MWLNLNNFNNFVLHVLETILQSFTFALYHVSFIDDAKVRNYVDITKLFLLKDANLNKLTSFFEHVVNNFFVCWVACNESVVAVEVDVVVERVSI